MNGLVQCIPSKFDVSIGSSPDKLATQLRRSSNDVPGSYRADWKALYHMPRIRYAISIQRYPTVLTHGGNEVYKACGEGVNVL